MRRKLAWRRALAAAIVGSREEEPLPVPGRAGQASRESETEVEADAPGSTDSLCRRSCECAAAEGVAPGSGGRGRQVQLDGVAGPELRASCPRGAGRGSECGRHGF